ncbi:hypothetical protein ACOMHN_027478 [Nucella lapillus]
MEFLQLTETARAREIDAELKKNKWRNGWLDETDKKDRPFRMWLQKCVEPGAAWCNLCSKKIAYRNNGKKSIASHSIETVHVERLDTLKHTSTLPAASPVHCPLSKVDSLVDAKIRTCAFLAEHCLPLSLAPELVAFCHKLAADTFWYMYHLNFLRLCTAWAYGLSLNSSSVLVDLSTALQLFSKVHC